MTPNEMHQLINRGIDGDLTGAEQRKLDQLLRRSAPARKMHADLSALAHSLDTMTVADPPVHLAQRIHARVAAPSPSAVKRPSILAALRTQLGLGQMVRYGSVFAGGLVLGAFLFMILVNPQGGTQIADESAAGSLLSKADTYTISLTGASGTVVSLPTPTGREVTLQLTCTSPTNVRFAFDPSRVKLENLRQVPQTTPPANVANGLIEMTVTGSERTNLSFGGVQDSRLSLEVSSTMGGSYRTEIPVH
ncbi:MAG TPA: hypothetical protein VEO56_01545 [Bacteroidota bacterium]|nr:hypothetical protein [Bacteroidota bacterium]